MMTRINTNISAWNAHRQLAKAALHVVASTEKLSSGLRVNRASDDAAGLTISEVMRAQIRGMAQAERNALDGISMLNVAEGALSEAHAGLHRIRELAVQGANGTLTDQEREAIRLEMESLENEVGNLLVNTSYNGKILIAIAGMDWSKSPLTVVPPGDSVTLQVGANAGETLGIRIDVNPPTGFGAGYDGSGQFLEAHLNLGTVIGPLTQADAQNILTGADRWISEISRVRSMIGATANRLEHVVNNVANARENLSAAESRIRDLDMANEMTQLTRSQILTRSGTAMLSTAFQQPQRLLALLA